MAPNERTEPVKISRQTFAIGAAITGVAGAWSGSALPDATAADYWPSPQDFAESTVFVAGEEGLAVFHVFGLTQTARGTVLAFAEGRITPQDAAPHHIVAKRSLDGGRTWGEFQYVRRSDGVQSLVNPTPVVERNTGRIFLFFAEGFRDPGNTGGSPDRSRLYLVSSDDDGVTWSEPIELTSLFDNNPHGWTLHMPGPGHGIQLADGRLLMQVWHRRAIAFPVPERGYGVSVLHSDDNGATWHHSGSVPLDAAYPVNESRLVERPDGSIVMAGRYASGGIHPRIVSVSTDRGRTWSDPVLDASMRPFNAVDAGFARITGGPDGDGPSRVVFSRPDSSVRQNLTVALSYDEGMTWAHSRVLTDGPASYSDTVALTGDRIGVLYGREHAPGITTSFSARIAFATFNLSWLTSGADAGPGREGVQHSYEIEALPVTASSDHEKEVVADPAASNGQRLVFAGTDYGAFVEVRIEVPAGGRYELHVRFRHLPNAGVVAISVDGEQVGGVVDTSTVSVRSFKTVTLGTTLLSRGRHTVRFTVVDKQVDSAGLRMSPDLLTLVPR